MFDRVLYEINPKPEGGWEVVRPFSWRLSAFLADRNAEITARRAPAALEPGPTVVLHLVPNDALDGTVFVDIRGMANSCPELRPLASGGANYRYNADGFLTDSPSADGMVSGYAQLFRNGIVEAATTDVFTERTGKILIASLLFEDEVIASVRRCVALAVRLGLAAPYFACINLLGVDGVVMATDSFRYWSDGGRRIDRERLQAPPVALDAQSDVVKELRPIFDYFWQAAGWPESHYYQEDGTRRR